MSNTEKSAEHTYTSVDGKVWPEETWITEDGRNILVRDLEVEHARNIIRMIIRSTRAQQEQFAQMFAALELVIATAEREESGQLLQ